MAIQTRRGSYDDFDPAKMLPGELATVTSGDPGANDGRSVYACFAAGDVKRMATYEDMLENISQATQDVQEEFTEQLNNKISQAETAISQAQSATSAANIAAQGANEAKQEALNAAEAAESYVLGDISSKTVTFSETSARSNINTGESTSTLFGKIKKWFSDLGAAAFQAVANNLTTTTEGSVLDARQGKALSDQINVLNTKTSYDLSGDSTITGVSCGKNRTVIFNGFNVTSNSPNSFELGEIFSPENTMPLPISIEGQGTGTLIINTAGQCSVYSANLSSYITGKIYGVVSFLKS